MIPPVKDFAQRKRMEFLQPERLKNSELGKRLEEINPDIGVVVSYGKFLPRSLFTIPRFNTINVHFSLLPRYRGAAPVQRALENGETVSGITIFEIDKSMDTGDIWSQMEVAISPHDTTGSMFEKLSREAVPFLVETIQSIFAGRLKKHRQDHSRATYAPPVDKKEGKVNWGWSASQLYNKYRAFKESPGLFFHAGDGIFKIKDAGIAVEKHRKRTGDVLDLDRKGLKVCCGGGTVLEIRMFQPQNKKPMSPYSYTLGNTLPSHLD